VIQEKFQHEYIADENVLANQYGPARHISDE
jgi:hypothetical protein